MSKLKVGAVILIGGVVGLLTIHAVKRLQNVPALLPSPLRLQARRGSFTLLPNTRILIERSDPSGPWLADRLHRSTGFLIQVAEPSNTEPGQGTISFSISPSAAKLGPEGYELEVAPHRVAVRGADSAGLFYGAQSLLQLFSPQIYSTNIVPRTEWKAPCVWIQDRPRFRWRGFMLDVSRHFFTPPEIERVLDTMALHKLNTFHWHLTDDQGWRIEIKKYPRLTEVGAWRKRIGFNLDPKSSSAYNPRGLYGGYYSQDQVREIVSYAQARHITIVPEIDLPGHSSAALAAYPQFSCSGGPYSTDMSENVSAGVFCPGREETFAFLEDVLREVTELFPGTFVHVGGDEVSRQNWRHCPLCQARMAKENLKSEHELEGYFIHRLETFLNTRGKRLVGWSEIRDGKLAPSTVLMDWIGGGVEAAKSGHDVVMCPEEDCYLDFYQSPDRSTEPLAAGAYLPLDKVYQFDPIPAGLTAQEQTHIIGAQANLWTEYVPSLSQLEYMVYPRLSALADVVWSPKESRDWQDFTRRLAVQEQRLSELGVRYHP